MRPAPAAFGARLRALRQRAGLSQASLAERAQLSTPTVAAIEQGLRRLPRLHTAAALSDALNLGPAERAELLQLVSRSDIPSDGDGTSAASSAPPERPSGVLVALTSLIGRETAIDHATSQLDPSGSAVRLLTLLGPGGVGKTRLAAAVAAALRPAYPDGVVMVDLAPLHDAWLVPATIARALEVRESAGRSARELVLEYLRPRQLLLVLDNFEHLLGATPLVAELLQQCPHLGLLVNQPHGPACPWRAPFSGGTTGDASRRG